MVDKGDQEGEIKMGRVLVTGGAGYVGSLLVRNLLNSGYSVRVLDKFMFGLNTIRDIIGHPNLDLLVEDITKVGDLSKALKDIDTVIHLAAIVGEPACAVHDAEIVFETNFVTPMRLAAFSRETNVKKFIFASTCSVYGANDVGIVNESSTPSPFGIYDKAKSEAEKQILLLGNNDFSPCILRLATVYGLSPRMRFDLAVNYMTMKAMTEKKVIVFGGNQWRPFVHVADAAAAFQVVLEAPISKVKGGIFNVGATKENYQIKEVGKLIKKLIPDVEVIYALEIEDKRSYNVSFDKIHNILGFTTTKRVDSGIIEIKDAIQQGVFKNPEDPIYYNNRVV